VKSVIASGNIIFSAEKQDVAELETKIETALLKATSVVTATIVRTANQIQELIDALPFKPVTDPTTHKPTVTFFKHSPDKSQLPEGGRGFKGYGFHAGAYCFTVDMTAIKTPEAMLTLEKEFGKEITTRTWGTVLKIAKLLS
jgi:uncharacterized protein (DUF1697 family)